MRPIWKKILLLALVAVPSGWIGAQSSSLLYVPPGYGPGQNAEGRDLSLDTGFKSVDRDYYVTITPSFELPLFGFRIGLQVPLEVLVYDHDPPTGQKVPSLRKGMYSNNTDYEKFVKYVRYGTHLYYDPADLFNWSFFYGQMTDGYIGHRTIINRFVSSYDPSVFRPGLMADINNNWGGVEAFASDIWNKEVRGGRAYIRPVGIFVSGYNAFTASSFSSQDVARSVAENRRARDEYFFEERLPEPGKGGSLRQHLYRTLREDLEDNRIEFKQVVDPVTGETRIEPVVRDANQPEKQPGSRDEGLEKAPDQEKKKSDKFTQGFLSRWAIGATSVTDYGAPTSLELDGSQNLVVDPYTLRPRGNAAQDLTIKGVDTELRLSPFKWLELTAYGDVNKIQDLDKSRGTHIGLLFEMKLSTLLRWYIRPEYREATSNYIPTYFDSYYAIERTVYIPPGATMAGNTPKLAYLKGLPDDGAIHKGFYVNSTIDFASFLVLETEYQDYAGPNNSQVMVGLYVPNISGVFADGYYMKKGYDRIQDSFKTDDHSLMAGEIGMQFYGGMYLKYTVRRTWVFSTTTSRYMPQDESGMGFGFSSKM